MRALAIAVLVALGLAAAGAYLAMFIVHQNEAHADSKIAHCLGCATTGADLLAVVPGDTDSEK